MPPPTNVPAIQLQAAVRGHKDRATIKARNSWMEDLSKGGKLTPRALGDANGELGSAWRVLSFQWRMNFQSSSGWDGLAPSRPS